MATLVSIAAVLDEQLVQSGVTRKALGSSAGLSHQTLINLLSGECDYRMSSFLAVLDRLGMELVLLPKEVAGASVSSPSSAPIKTRVQRLVGDES